MLSKTAWLRTKGCPRLLYAYYLSREDSKKFYEEEAIFEIGKIEMVSIHGTDILIAPSHC